MTGELTKTETASLADCEQIIERGMATFIDVGRALLQIRDKRLYRGAHASFEAYCKERWDFDQSYGHRMANSAKVVEVLEHSPIGKSHLPTCEAQVRPLTALEPSEVPDVWREVVDRAGKERITAKLVDEVVKWWKSPSDDRREAEPVAVDDTQERDLESDADDLLNESQGSYPDPPPGVAIEDDLILADDPKPAAKPPRSLVAEAVELATSWAEETGNTIETAAGYLQVAAVELRDNL
jgi:hypothetical protein